MKDDSEKIQSLRRQIDRNSKRFQSIVNDIIHPYVEDLDEYVDFIKKVLTDYEDPPTPAELDEFIMNLSVYIYYASSMQEHLGIKDDIARALYKETYHSARDNIEKGTVADKDSQAELLSQQEMIVSMIHKRAYAIVKAKVAAAQEILASVKKVISRRVAEMELTRIGGSKQ